MTTTMDLDLIDRGLLAAPDFETPVDATSADDATLAAWVMNIIDDASHKLWLVIGDDERTSRVMAMAIQSFNCGEGEDFCDLLNSTDCDAVYEKYNQLIGHAELASLKEAHND